MPRYFKANIFFFIGGLYLFQIIFCAGTSGPVPALDMLVKRDPDVKMYRGSDYTAYQVNDVRVYFSYWLQVGLSGFEEQEDSMNDYYQSCLNHLGSLFRMGVLTGELFYAKYNGYRSLEPVNSGSAEYHDFKPSMAEDEPAFPGRMLKIMSFEEIAMPNEPLTRVYSIWVQMDKTGNDWGTIDQYALQIKLPYAKEKDFALRYQDVELVNLKYVRD